MLDTDDTTGGSSQHRTKAERDAERQSAVEDRIQSACAKVLPHFDRIDWPSLIGVDIVWSEDDLPTLTNTPESVTSLDIDDVDLVIAGVQSRQFSVYRDGIVAVPGYWDYRSDHRREIKKELKGDE